MHDALVSPFHGERYADLAQLSARIAPPYDVVSPQERAELAKRDRHNIVHVILPEGDADRYDEAARHLSEWRAAGVLVRDAKPSVTVVRETFTTPDGRACVRTGVIAGVVAEPFTAGRVRPHERTHAGPKQDRLSLLRATQATCEVLLMLARDESGELQRLLDSATAREPDTSAALRGVRLELWRVAGARAGKIAQAAGRGALYVADGHHRYETAVAYRDEHPDATQTSALIVPIADPGLVVLPVHRVVHGEAIDADRVEQDLRERFQVRDLASDSSYAEELAKLRGRGTACVMVLPQGRALALLLKSGVSLGDLPFANQKALASLDVARLDAIVVKRLVTEAGKNAAVSYRADIGEVIDLVRNRKAVAGVLLNPARVEQVLAVADSGGVMPPKSTYFFPKVPSGLVMMPY